MGRAQHRLRLLKPKPHVHLAVHRGRGREVLANVLALADAAVQLAEPEVACLVRGKDSRQLLEQRLGFFQVRGVKSLGEPAIDLC